MLLQKKGQTAQRTQEKKTRHMDANNAGSSVTLIFYRIQPEWWREPVINILAAACQQSNLTHVEIAIGEQAGSDGTKIGNVCRVFNDATGVVRLLPPSPTPTLPTLLLPPALAPWRVLRRAWPSCRFFCVCVRAGARRPHGPQPALHVPAARLLQGGRARNAPLCA